MEFYRCPTLFHPNDIPPKKWDDKDIQFRDSLGRWWVYVVLNVSFIFQALTKFWRKLRPKTLSKDFLSHINFTILGLGDTNYNQFCNAPKKLRNRLKELGNIFIFIFMNWYGIYVNILTGVNCLFSLLIWTLFIGQFVKKEGRRWGKEVFAASG